jgi:hypothetical protein
MQNQHLQQIQDQVEAKMDPKDHDNYRRIVVAGMKLMFDKSTFGDVIKQFNPQRPAESVANGIIGIGAILMKKSKKTMPITAAIAAMNTLLLHALDFLDAAGKLKATPALVAETTSIFLETIMQQAGLNQERMGKIIEMTQKNAMQAKGAA